MDRPLKIASLEPKFVQKKDDLIYDEDGNVLGLKTDDLADDEQEEEPNKMAIDFYIDRLIGLPENAVYTKIIVRFVDNNMREINKKIDKLTKIQQKINSYSSHTNNKMMMIGIEISSFRYF